MYSHPAPGLSEPMQELALEPVRLLPFPQASSQSLPGTSYRLMKPGFTLKIADKLESEFFNVMPIALAKGLVEGFLPPFSHDIDYRCCNIYPGIQHRGNCCRRRAQADIQYLAYADL